jgi:hypothetical protein
MKNKEEVDMGFAKSAKRAWSYNVDKERIIKKNDLIRFTTRHFFWHK